MNKKKRHPGFAQSDVLCPECGAEMILRRNRKFRYENQGDFRLFYGCSRFPDCKGTHGAHPDGEPLGKPAPPIVKAARIKAHEAFEARRQRVNLSRCEAYLWLARAMCIPLAKCHFSLFSLEECELASALCNKGIAEI